MDFSDYSTFPAVANPDYPPTPDAFTPKNSAALYATLPVATRTPAPLKTPYNPTLNSSAPFGQLEQFPFGFTFEPIHDPIYASVSSLSQHPRTPSLRSDDPQQFQAPSSLELSPHLSPKRESTDDGAEVDVEPMPKRPQRKRGRPRLDRSNSDTSASSKCHRTSRLPHNQVERKYREGLNAELERLRRSVPTLPQREEGGVMGQPKPSKAMVLASAIDYIEKVTRERDRYRVENERLRNFD